MDFQRVSIEEIERQLKHQLKLYFNDEKNVESDIVIEKLYDNLLQEVTLGVVFEVHRAAKIGLMNAEDGPHIHDSNHFALVESPDVDIFGQQPIKKPHECVCPSCKRNLGAMKFAPHLEKCMGMGRNSSRIASRRIANNSKENSAYSGMMSDDDDDADWTAGSDRRKKKKERNGTRRPKNQKNSRNGDAALEGGGTNTDISNSNMNYDTMTHDEKKNLLMQICGVISEHTRRLCTRSVRCPQHTDEQRRAVRAALLNPHISEMNVGPDMTQVDVDTYEDGDVQNMRESLGRSWEQEHSNTSSPADSASTSSSSSKKREKIPKPKSKSSKSHKSSPNFANNNNHNSNNSYNNSSINPSVQD